MIVPEFKPREYTAIVNDWVAQVRRISGRRKLWVVRARTEIQGRWQHWKPGKQFVGYLARDGWHVIALRMRVRFPVTMCCVERGALAKVREYRC
jgi:hypothetical protein